MDLIDMIYANEMEKAEMSHSTYIFHMQNGIENDPYITENAWKYEVYARLRWIKKKITDVSEQDIEEKANSIMDQSKRSDWLYARALIISEFYWLPLRMVYDRDSYEWVPDDKFRMLQKYWRISDAYYKYQIQEQWELEPDGKVKQLEPVKNNDINKIDIDSTNIEIEEWKKILQRYENMLANETDEEKRAEILSDMEKAKKALRDLSSK